MYKMVFSHLSGSKCDYTLPIVINTKPLKLNSIRNYIIPFTLIILNKQRVIIGLFWEFFVVVLMF